MLLRLGIRDIVLIDRLDLDFSAGLTVLTGETGAGKSILLDSLGLVLGARADAGLVRAGAEQGTVTAEFAIEPAHPAAHFLREQGWEVAGQVILRRVLSRDGRSRAFVDDQSASVGLLAQLGALLVEVHGQHDDRGLLNPSGHRALLDAFGGFAAELAGARAAHAAAAAAARALAAETEAVAAARRDEDYLRHVAAELAQLSPLPGEEAALAQERHAMVEGERAVGEIEEIAASLAKDGGIDSRLRGAQRRLERLGGRLGERLERALAAIERAATEAEEAMAAIAELRGAVAFDERRLEDVEERLFALRAAGRKHQVTPDELPALARDLAARVAGLEAGEERLAALTAANARAAAAFDAAAAALSAARAAAAGRLDAAVNGELDALKLGRAKFRTAIAPVAREQWGPEGGDRVVFEVATNPGAPFGPLVKIASGGELARFILALKVVLAGAGSAQTLIFDEVDRGIGGAVADAVGDRLAKLAHGAQVLVVTHSPQVAARGRHHLRIAKEIDLVSTRTRVSPLEPKSRREEIARMLSGSEVTAAARAAADALLKAARG